MMDQNEYLNQIAEDCMEVLDRLSIPYRNVTEFVINRRAKRWVSASVSQTVSA